MQAGLYKTADWQETLAEFWEGLPQFAKWGLMSGGVGAVGGLLSGGGLSGALKGGLGMGALGAGAGLAAPHLSKFFTDRYKGPSPHVSDETPKSTAASRSAASRAATAPKKPNEANPHGFTEYWKEQDAKSGP